MPLAISPDLQHAGMGAIPHEQGVAFRVWAPNADSVFVVGDFNKWANDATPMQPDETGTFIYSQDKREGD
ncbi:MAG TPA: hypothetical protein VMM76_02140 [Pirellulaceae bacterium]|nr:hypothetical protein [Pirellulaceae bacterium]